MAEDINNDHYNKDDPDYKDFHQEQLIDPSKAQAEDSKQSTVSRIHRILEKQFCIEIDYKEQEVNKIEHRIHQTKLALDRLRAYAVAGYYGSGGKIIPCAKAKLPQSKRKKHDETAEEPIVSLEDLQKQDLKSLDQDQKDSLASNVKQSSSETEETTSRFYTSKKVIVGNVSKYLVADVRKENDKSTHKWMVYVRTDSDDENNISRYVKCVQFFLHPSYIPNDIVTVNKPPFQVTRRGWGEFPVRVQLYFKDARNKRFDVIHNLKLDKTYTGLQTLGAETIVNLELNRHTSIPGAITSSTDNVEMDSKHTDFQVAVNTSVAEEPKKKDLEETSYIQKLPPLTLPIIADLRSRLPSLECASIASSCVSSANPSRCNSPVNESPANSILTEPEIENILYCCIDKAPLIAGKDSVNLHHFTCSSVELYKMWHFTKRRACEWQRSLFLKDLVLEHLYTNGKNLKCPSTKEIMLWLRLSGFTPPESGLKVVYDADNFCSICGKIIVANPQTKLSVCMSCKKDESNAPVLESSLSSYTSVLSNIKIKEETLQAIEKVNTLRQESESEVEIDIVCSEKVLHNPVQKLHSVEDTIMPTDLENWVTDTCQYLGISIQPVVLSDSKTFVVNAMLNKAMKSFLCHLLRRSNIEAKQGNKLSMTPTMVTFKHVCSALNNVQVFDFLTDAHLGKL